jgi:hypothetical protein
MAAGEPQLLRRARENWLTIAAGLGAALPVIIAVAEALRNRWVPLADDGIIVLRSWDVFTDQSPLVGQYSQVTAEGVGDAFSPGPLLYWLLALPLRLAGIDAVPVTIGLVGVASIMGAVALARRRAGVAFMLATAFALAVMCNSLPSEYLRIPFNPTVPLLPTALLIFVAWSLARGEIRWLPVAVFLASFIVQTHLSYVPVVVGLLGVGVAGLIWGRPRTGKTTARGAHCSPRTRRWVLASVVVGLLCWSAPLVDLLTNDPSNLEVLARTATADRPNLGADVGWHAVVRAFGVPPWWLQPHVGGASRFLDVANPPHALSSVSFFVVTAGLLAIAVGAFRRRRAVAIAALLALILIPAFGAVAASTPADKALTLGYTMQWGSPAGMFAWLVLALGTATLSTPVRSWAQRKLARPGFRRLTPALGLALVVLTGVGVGIAERPDPKRWLYAPARSTIAHLEREVSPGETVLLSRVPFEIYGAVTFALRRSGVRVLVVPPVEEAVDDHYDAKGRRYDESVVLMEGARAAPEGGRILARIWTTGAPPPRTRRVFTLALARAK